MLDIERLDRKWQEYYPLVHVPSNNRLSDRVFTQLVNAYSLPDSPGERLRQRDYHNLTHIDCVLATIDRFDDLQNPRAVYFAAWFHDFVYDSQATDNESKSAVVARELLTNLGESIATIDRVEQLILATKGHQIDPDDRDRCIFLDADLAILGADPVRYQAYQQAIRREYSWVSDRDYRAGRTQVLNNFLQRNRLYYTDLLFTELESIARLNIAREIALLIP